MSNHHSTLRVSVIVQARMSSKRLPGKVSLDLGGKSVLTRLLQRLSVLPKSYNKIVATSTNDEDDVIAQIARETGWNLVRGALDDVMSRFSKAIDLYPGNFVVRVTADNPYTDPYALTKMVELASEKQADYIHSPDMPVGTAADVFSRSCFKICSTKAQTPYQREHINAYVLDNVHMFDIFRYKPIHFALENRNIRLTVDTPEDYQQAREIYKAINGDMNTSLDTILAEGKRLQNA